MLSRSRPYWLHAYVLVYTALGLYADGKVTSAWQQDGLGVLSFTALFLLSLKAAPALRLQVWLCVVIATGYEIFFSLVWGVYHYRMHNVPLYVPAGHGIVYLFGLMAVQTPLIQRYGRKVAYAVLGIAATWALLGLVVFPSFTGRIDVQGAMFLPILAWFLLRSPRWPVFAAVFVIVAELEICGTTVGDWSWAAYAPWTHIPSANPPSVVAGGYCIIDATVLALLWFYRVGLNTIITRITTTSSPSSGPITRLLFARRVNSAEVVSPASANLI